MQCVLTLRAVYHLALRAAQGLTHSVVTLLQVSLPVPTYSTLARRGARSEVALSRFASSTPVPLVLDSSGCKVYGEGEWKVRHHGWSKRRTWRKLHLGGEEATGASVAAVASEAGVTEADFDRVAERGEGNKFDLLALHQPEFVEPLHQPRLPGQGHDFGLLTGQQLV